MNDISFNSWISIVGPLAGFIYLLYRKVERNDERWLDTQGKILAIMSRLDMNYTDPTPSQVHPTAKRRTKENGNP